MTNEEKYKTPEERDEAFHRFCKSVNDCSICPAGKISNFRCPFAWLALEAEEEKPLPCPICGGDAESVFIPSFRYSHFVRCKICLLSIRGYDTKDKAIAAWNRRTK